ncbi:hypothetical protein PAND9192_03318 [Photobacterium andalusiense]|uniref:Uncharacterized protein n=1 Tax=Photobacterium andalusiense TaxID=2204296 RepID=A0A1Y6MRG3_9GAMM|nr:hypothetical protein PAND9192_03318 [Photobacterium andalusiense]
MGGYANDDYTKWDKGLCCGYCRVINKISMEYYAYQRVFGGLTLID